MGLAHKAVYKSVLVYECLSTHASPAPVGWGLGHLSEKRAAIFLHPRTICLGPRGGEGTTFSYGGILGHWATGIERRS